MTKVIINSCFGGFGVSHEAVLRWCELNEINVWPAKGKYDMWMYWTCEPTDSRRIQLDSIDFDKLDHSGRGAYNTLHSEITLPYMSGLDRTDKTMIKVVKEMGEKSWGDCARLSIVEIPNNVKWEIQEYDGMEHIAEVHRTWG
jgi:hypothetical protein